MASKLTSADIAEITRQSDVTSKPVRDNFTNLKNKTNEIIDDLAAVAIGTTNAETTAARPYNTNLKERLDQIRTNQFSIDSGGVVTINVGDSQKVDVTAGTGTINGIQVKWSAATSATIAYTSANTRYDVVVINSDNTVTLVTGAESATPVLPAVASTQKAVEVLSIGTASVALGWDCRDQGCLYFNEGYLNYTWKIQDAIDDLSSGGNIFVGRGTYYETLTYDDDQYIEFEGGAVLNTAAGVTVDYIDIDITDKTNSKIIWSGGAVGNGGKYISFYNPVGNGFSVGSVTHPAISALSDSRIAFIDNSTDQLRTYDFDGTDWSQTGNSLSITSSSDPTITALSSTRVAFIDSTNEDLRTYDFDGTDWSQTGNDLNISTINVPSITALSSTRIAFIDDTNDDLRTYDFDGTDWSQTGNDLNISGVADGVSICGLSSSRVALVDGGNDDLRTYDFDGTDWSLTGNSFSLNWGVSQPRVTTIKENEIVLVDSGLDSFIAYSFNGTDWNQIGSAVPVHNIGTSFVGRSGLTSLKNSRIVFLESNIDTLQTFDLMTTFVFKDNANTTPPGLDL